jgi:hypothetical protein
VLKKAIIAGQCQGGAIEAIESAKIGHVRFEDERRPREHGDCGLNYAMVHSFLMYLVPQIKQTKEVVQPLGAKGGSGISSV